MPEANTMSPDRNYSEGMDARGSNDSLLWTSLRQGSREAFEVVYRKHVDRLYNYGMYVFMDNKLVEDAVHDVFVELWRRREHLSNTSSIRFYLCRALKNNIVRKLKTKERLSVRYSLPDDFALDHIESPEFELIASQLSKETSETLNRAIHALPEKQRDIIIYRFYNNLSSQEISSRMSIGLDSTYTLLSRALRELRKNIKDINLLLLIGMWLF